MLFPHNIKTSYNLEVIGGLDNMHFGTIDIKKLSLYRCLELVEKCINTNNDN